MSKGLLSELDRTHEDACLLSQRGFDDCPVMEQAGLHESLGLLLILLREPKMALSEFHSALRIMYRVTVPAFRILRCASHAAAAHMALGDPHGAIRECSKALILFDRKDAAYDGTFRNQNPLHIGDLHKMMGDSFMHLREWNKALHCFDRALRTAAWRFALQAEIYQSMSVAYAHLNQTAYAHQASWNCYICRSFSHTGSSVVVAY